MLRRRKRRSAPTSPSRHCCAISASAPPRCSPRIAGRGFCCSRISAMTPTPGCSSAAPTSPVSMRWRSTPWWQCSGPPSCALVSLLEDARRDVSASLRRAMTERYLAAFPELDRSDFLRAAAILAAQRNCKILGIFTRLWKRDGKPQYLAHIPRVWRLLEEDLRHPALARIGCWLDCYLPRDIRCRPDLRSEA